MGASKRSHSHFVLLVKRHDWLVVCSLDWPKRPPPNLLDLLGVPLTRNQATPEGSQSPYPLSDSVSVSVRGPPSVSAVLVQCAMVDCVLS